MKKTHRVKMVLSAKERSALEIARALRRLAYWRDQHDALVAALALEGQHDIAAKLRQP